MTPALTEAEAAPAVVLADAPVAKQAVANGSNPAAAPAKRHEEHQYLDLVREIMDSGEHRPDR